MTGLFPFAAAKCNGVEPVVPIMGAELSLFFSFEYLRGNLQECRSKRGEEGENLGDTEFTGERARK